MEKSSSRTVYYLWGALGIVAVISAVVFFKYQEQSALTDSYRIKAERETVEASKKMAEAVLISSEADKQRQLAEQQNAIASKALIEARDEAKKSKEQLDKSILESKQALEIARQNSLEASAQKKMADMYSERAQFAEAQAARARHIAQGKLLAIKSVDLTDPQQRALVALQAYKFNLHYFGNPSDEDIYNGLVQALKQFNDPLVINPTKPTTSADLAMALCNYIKRDMTREEWENFVGSDLPFEKACNDTLRTNN